MSDSLFAVHLPVYEGPMDLLLYVVRQRHVDLLELPLAQIARDFLEYARRVESLDLDVAGEVILTAAILLRMKVRAMLPGEEEEEGETARELLRDEELEEAYREVIAAARRLAENEEEQRKQFPRGGAAGIVEVDETGEILRDVSLLQLAEAFRDLTRRMEHTPVHQLAMFRVTMEEMSARVLLALKGREKVRFNDLAEEFEERMEAIVAFLAILELIRRGYVRVRQRGLFGTIWLQRGARFEEGLKNGEAGMSEGAAAMGGVEG